MTRGDGSKMKEGRLRLGIRRKSFSIGAGCPEKLRMLLHWKCSWLGWMRLGAPGLVGGVLPMAGDWN